MTDVTSEEGACQESPDGQHCEHWWDGEPCHFCGAPEMPMEQKVKQGMVEGPVRNPNG